MLQQAGRAIGIAVASISSFVQPELVLLVGGISEAGGCLVDAANRSLIEFGAEFYRCPIREGAFGSRAPLVGAATSALWQERDA